VPAASLDVTNVALLVDELKLPLPSVVLPSLNVTVPPIKPATAGTMVAVKVTEYPTIAGLSEEPSRVAVASLFTVFVRAAEVLAASLRLPP
jgi:hypothetical protein